MSPPSDLPKSILQRLFALFTNPEYFWILAFLVIIGDAVLTELVIRFISYTEIDWKTYMVQVRVYLKGERNYSKISGPTGLLVYPAGHVHIHQFLYYLTDAGRDVALAQQIYAVLYLTTLTLSCAIYRGAGGVPNWVVLLLPLSKRLHSIFVLRLFNDCWSLLPMQLAILAYQNGMDDLGTLLFSAALSIKMSIILYLPGILVILFRRKGLAHTLRYIITLVAVQTFIAYTFVNDFPWEYIRGSFDLSRVFLYKWTVNWRFVDENTFLSATWARSLLIGHVSVLVAFGLFRWCGPDGNVWSILKRGIRRPYLPAGLAPISKNDVTIILFTSNLIGIIFARSLHYQFYSWYAQQIPFLAWKTRYPIVVKLLLIGAIEYAWNIFPSTQTSSVVLLVANSLLLVGIWATY